MNVQQPIAVDPAKPGGDKTVILIVGGSGFRSQQALLHALGAGDNLVAFLGAVADAEGLTREHLESMDVQIMSHLLEPMPMPMRSPAYQPPIWSADYRNKRGRR